MAELRQRQPPIRCPKHLAWIRRQPCCVVDCRMRPSQAHHVRTGTNGGTSMKPSDGWCAPICAAHHSELHRLGNETFANTYDVDLRHVAATLASQSPYLPTDT